MADFNDLASRLQDLDGRSYPAYKGLKGSWTGADFTLRIDHVQGDPFAAPSRVSLLIPARVAALPPKTTSGRDRRLGVAAWLARAFVDRSAGSHGRGSGKSGSVGMTAPGQLVLPQTAVQVSEDGAVEARITVGLPARGRRIMGREAARILTEVVPELVRRSLVAAAHAGNELVRAAEANEDAEALREALDDLDLVAFVADGAILPRMSGDSDLPMHEGAIPFESPEGLRVTLHVPNAGPVTGMGIRAGVTLVVGGGFHGKSTLLQALEAGVYNHRPGDGRERVVTRRDAVRIRAEEGRAVTGVDISPFINNLPAGEDTVRFTTANASGSTSQAAALVEALEVGSRVILMDEDSCATNFLIRDRRMQELVPSADEPITPLVDRIRSLYEDGGVSTVLALGGSGDYLDVADTVIGMNRYRPRDLTAAARSVAERLPTGRVAHPGTAALPRPRSLAAGSLPQGKRDRGLRVRVQEGGVFLVGRERLELAALEQLLLPAQRQTVAAVLESMEGDTEWAGVSLSAWARQVSDHLRADPGSADDRRRGDLAAVRACEIAGALNRLRTLRLE